MVSKILQADYAVECYDEITDFGNIKYPKKINWSTQQSYPCKDRCENLSFPPFCWYFNFGKKKPIVVSNLSNPTLYNSNYLVKRSLLLRQIAVCSVQLRLDKLI